MEINYVGKLHIPEKNTKQFKCKYIFLVRCRRDTSRDSVYVMSIGLLVGNDGRVQIDGCSGVSYVTPCIKSTTLETPCQAHSNL